ncbi:MAG: hypothetical protein PHT07_02280 [Paludibacter sp.]|nr:hypothetical protein [Paludibacter sp.]
MYNKSREKEDYHSITQLDSINIQLIKTESDYRNGLKRLEVIFDAIKGTPESDEADVLALLIDEYEKKHYKIEAPDPIERLKSERKKCT